MSHGRRTTDFQLDPPAQSRSRERPVSARLARYGLADPMAQDQKPRLLAERGERRAVQQGAACAFGALAVEIKRLVPPPGGGCRPSSHSLQATATVRNAPTADTPADARQSVACDSVMRPAWVLHLIGRPPYRQRSSRRAKRDQCKTCHPPGRAGRAAEPVEYRSHRDRPEKTGRKARQRVECE